MKFSLCRTLRTEHKSNLETKMELVYMDRPTPNGFVEKILEDFANDYRFVWIIFRHDGDTETRLVIGQFYHELNEAQQGRAACRHLFDLAAIFYRLRTRGQ